MERSRALLLCLMLCAASAGSTDCGGESPTVPLPPPEDCSGHDETECLADDRCEALYSSDCVCPAICRPAPDGEGCLPCECASSETYAGCRERSVCETFICDAIYCPYGNLVGANGCTTSRRRSVSSR